MPTLMGYDTDSPKARGECGKCGVAIDTLKDMEDLFAGLPIDQITTSMTINPPAAVMWAMYIAMAENRGIDRKVLGGTIQNDMLKEFAAQKTFMCPPEPSVRIVTDTVEFGTHEVPRWNTISISGYHIREAGSTAVQELAFTLADGIAYTEKALERGLQVDQFAPRFSFFFNSHLDFFEEVAKFRAARRMWARIMKERFKAKDPRSLWMRFHTQTAGCSLTAQQPYNNVVRTALQGLAAVMGGTQSLHTNSLDEVLAIPTEEAATIALRTQQIIAEESGVANTIDPLGGSYFVEALTNRWKKKPLKLFRRSTIWGGCWPPSNGITPSRRSPMRRTTIRNRLTIVKKSWWGSTSTPSRRKISPWKCWKSMRSWRPFKSKRPTASRKTETLRMFPVAWNGSGRPVREMKT
jgi:methylmalonyl-CoA mutase N-terminal domain/subunit